MKVAQVMQRGTNWIAPDLTLADIVKQMHQHNIGALPVGQDNRLIGIVTDRDIVLRGLESSSDPLQLTARDVMSEPIVYCNVNEELEDVVRIMERKQLRHLPVLDANRRMVGMLRLGDVAAQGSASLAGEILKAITAHHS